MEDMNTRKIMSLSIGALLTGLVGCGQGYTPSPEENTPAPHGGGDVFGSNDDDTVYRTASYEVLRYTLVNVLALGEAPNAAIVTASCAAPLTANTCPKGAPVQFLDANRSAFGVPVYNTDDPLGTQAPGAMSSGGYKTWILSVSSACGRMMDEQAEPAVFPNGVSDYNRLYNVTLGRAPTAAEITRLDELRATLDTPQKQGAAVCSSVLGSLEFLTVN